MRIAHLVPAAPSPSDGRRRKSCHRVPAAAESSRRSCTRNGKRRQRRRVVAAMAGCRLLRESGRKQSREGNARAVEFDVRKPSQAKPGSCICTTPELFLLLYAPSYRTCLLCYCIRNYFLLSCRNTMQPSLVNPQLRLEPTTRFLPINF